MESGAIDPASTDFPKCLRILFLHFRKSGDKFFRQRCAALVDRHESKWDPESRVELIRHAAMVSLGVMDAGTAISRCCHGVEVCKAAGLDHLLPDLVNFYGDILHFAGMEKEAERVIENALQLAAMHPGNARARITHLTSLFDCYVAQGRFDEADRCSKLMLDDIRKFPDDAESKVARLLAHVNYAQLQTIRGKLASAEELLEAASSDVSLQTSRVLRWVVNGAEALLRVALDNHDNTRAYFESVMTLGRHITVGNAFHLQRYYVLLLRRMGDFVNEKTAVAEISRSRAEAYREVILRGGVDQWMLAGTSGDAPIAPIAPHHAAIAVAAARKASLDLLERLSVTAELRDDFTGRHCYRVGWLAHRLAERTMMDAATLKAIRIAARLHDIGKLAIPDAILNKPARLNAEEIEIMKTHAPIGAQLLAGSELTEVQIAERIARHHHEWWNGNGYPDGLAGETIPLAARVTALADVYDALTHVRSYKRAWSRADALAYIEQHSGTQFDPQLAPIFVAMIREAEADWPAFSDQMETDARGSPFVRAREVFVANGIQPRESSDGGMEMAG